MLDIEHIKITIDTFFPDLTEIDFQNLAEYYETLETHLQHIENQDYQSIRSDIGQLDLSPEDRYDEWDIARQGLEVKYRILYKNFARFSIITLLWLVVENRLSELCGIVAERRKKEAPKPHREIANAYRKFLDEVEVKISPKLWESILNLNKVRNCIVHRYGKLKGYQYEKHLRNLAQHDPALSISGRDYDYDEIYPIHLEDDILVLHADYCRNAIQNARRFFEELCKAVPLLGMVIEESWQFELTPRSER